MTAVRLLPLLFFSFLSLLLPPSLSVTVSDAEALLKFKESLTPPDALATWKPNTSPCNPKSPWVGVVCADDNINSLRFEHLGLSGEINVSPLQDIDSLRVISLEDNSFSGPIPEFNLLGALKAIHASKNNFSGQIPPEFFGKMGSLKRLQLAENKFSGGIPISIGKLPNLRELRLEGNQFSGQIPSIRQPSLVKLDLSNNKLEGEIPESLSRFGAPAFEGNPRLCGKQVGVECKKLDDVEDNDDTSLGKKKSASTATPNEPENAPPEGQRTSQAKWVILTLVVALLLLTVLFKAKRKDDSFNLLGKENLDEVVQVHIPSTNKRSMSSLKKGSDSGRVHHTGSSRRGSSSQHGRSVGDLVVVNEERGVFGLQDLMKAAAEVLGNGGLGSAYKAVMGSGVAVVVKRLREANKMSKDEFDTDMRRMGRLRHRNILTPLAYHYRKEEKLLVSDYVPKGSLLYTLHGDRGSCHAELNWPNRIKIIRGVARGMGFLHSEFASYELPHGNLKSCNVLLSSNYEPLLTDYALYPLINNSHATQSLFAYKSPEAILYQQISPKSDVFCLGIIILEILTGKFPSQYLNNQKGGTDVVQWVRSAVSEKRESELIDPEISGGNADSVGQMEKLLHIGAACTESDHDKRIDMKEAIRRIEEIKV